LIEEVQATLGPISVLHWNAYAHAAGDLTLCDISEIQTVLNVAVMGLVTAVQAALPDLRAAAPGDAAVLETGGGYALYEPTMDALAAKFGGMGLSVAKAAQHKLVGVLHAKLAPEGVFVGEVTVLGIVKGTAADRGRGTIEASAVAERLLTLYRERSAPYAQVN
jgi:NAD(P)-dependent dehydrogenase (short-subunit alcohol dehydrogenase family)